VSFTLSRHLLAAFHPTRPLPSRLRYSACIATRSPAGLNVCINAEKPLFCQRQRHGTDLSHRPSRGVLPTPFWALSQLAQTAQPMFAKPGLSILACNGACTAALFSFPAAFHWTHSMILLNRPDLLPDPLSSPDFWSATRRKFALWSVSSWLIVV